MRIEELLQCDKEYGLVPFWFWNSDLNEDVLDAQMLEMHEKHVYEFIIHARRGLTVNYLSDEWFNKVGFVLDKAKELGMSVWIYDEENWPSGYCSGRVMKEDPDFGAKHLKMIKTTVKQAALIHEPLCILMEQNHQFINITPLLSNFEPNQEVFVFIMQNTCWPAAYSDSFYVDLLNTNCVKTFMKLTHYEYEMRFKQYFGNVVKGFFTDEPGFYQNLYMFGDRGDLNTVVWTKGFSDYFKKRNKYSIIEYLPYLWIDGKESHQIRYDFYQTVTDLYIESFFKPQREFCEAYNMKLIGHVDFEEYLHMQVNVQGDMTKVLGSLHYAGTDKIDIHNEKINEKLVSSIGHMYNHKRILSETYALTGWGLDFVEMRRIADYQYVRGINLLNPHAFYYSIEGDRMFECPPSQFIQNPYWAYYAKFSDYMTRLSKILSLGKHVCDIAVYYPMPTAYDLFKPDHMDDVIKVDQLIQEITFKLLGNQYDFDFITDEALCNGKIGDEQLMISGESYRVLILPGVTTLLYETLVKLKEFVDAGGILFICAQIPDKCIDERDDFRAVMNELLKKDNCYYIDEYTLNKLYTYQFDIKKFDIIYNKMVTSHQMLTLNPQLDIDLFQTKYLTNPIKDVILIKDDPHIKYLHRKISHLDVYYLINEDDTTRKNTVLVKSVGLLKELDLLDGKIIDYRFKKRGDYTEFQVEWSPFSSKIFVVDTTRSIEEFSVDDYVEIVERKITGEWELHIDDQTLKTHLVDWSQLGYATYSGEGTYLKTISMSSSDLLYVQIILELEDFRDCAEVYINNELVDTKIWYPYHFDLKKYLKEGENNLKINVVNTLLNSFNQVPKVSGLTKPVKILFFK